MSKVKPGEWLEEHMEAPQPFSDYTRFNKPSKQRNTIYMLPLGNMVQKFSSESSTPASSATSTSASASSADDHPVEIESLREFVEAFYFGMTVKILPLTEDIKKQMRKVKSRIHYGKKQYFTPHIMSMLKNIIPNDAYCLIGITMTDLYPKEEWNFVFGIASTMDRMGVFSFARYDPSFYDPETNETREQRIMALFKRSCRVCSHEIGHMFGITHCVYYHCLMNGSNSREESDSRPSELCPVCLRKLQKAIGFDVVKRYNALLAFYSKMYPTVFDEETDWIKTRVAYIEQSK